MTNQEKLDKAARVATKLVNDYGKESDFAEAMALWMVINNCYKVKRATMAAFLAGPQAAERFRAQLDL